MKNFKQYLEGREAFYRRIRKSDSASYNELQQSSGAIVGIANIRSFLQDSTDQMIASIRQRKNHVESLWWTAMNKADESGGLLTASAAADKAERLWGEMTLLGRAEKWLKRHAAGTSANGGQE